MTKQQMDELRRLGELLDRRRREQWRQSVAPVKDSPTKPEEQLSLLGKDEPCWKLQNKLLTSGMALCPSHVKSGEWDSIARSVAVEMLRLEAAAKPEEQACG